MCEFCVNILSQGQRFVFIFFLVWKYQLGKVSLRNFYMHLFDVFLDKMFSVG